MADGCDIADRASEFSENVKINNVSLNINEEIGILSDNFNTNTNDSSNETVEAFIERRYQEIQNVHRKDEITSLKHILTEYINTEIKKVAEKTFQCCLHKDDSEKRILIETLTEEIRFLRKEIENKNFIIHNILSTKPTMHDKVDSLQNLSNVTNLANDLTPSKESIPRDAKSTPIQCVPFCPDIHTPSSDTFIINNSDSPPDCISTSLSSDVSSQYVGDLENQLQLVRQSFKKDFLRNSTLPKLKTPFIVNSDDEKLKSCHKRLKKLVGYGKNYKTVNKNEDDGTSCIIGDSMVKNLKSYKLTNSLNSKERVVVRTFPGATVSDINVNAKQLLDEINPQRIIIHVGTNDLKTSKSPNEIGESIINMVSDFNSGRKSIFHVSSIIARGDHLNEKAKAVNSVVRRLCQERNVCFIDHENINPDIHLNNSRLHFARNLIRILSKY